MQGLQDGNQNKQHKRISYISTATDSLEITT